MSLHAIQRDWAAKSKRYAHADTFLVSIPKSGRAWLRFQIRHYLCALGGVPFSIDAAHDEPPSVPRLACTHDLWEHLTAPRWRDRARGKYLIPPGGATLEADPDRGERPARRDGLAAPAAHPARRPFRRPLRRHLVGDDP